MKKLFLALRDQISGIPDIKYIHKWNNQLQLIIKEGGARSQMFQMPAAFIAFITADIQQLGEGRQMFNVVFEIHLLHWQMDAGDGTFEQNLAVFDLKDLVFAKVQKFQPGLTDDTLPVGACIRFAEEEDNNHNGVYHFIQRYKTTFIEEIMTEPVGGIDGPVPPLPLEIDVTTVRVETLATPYDPLIQYLAAENPYVLYQDNYYVCGLDTPAPAGAFSLVYWQLVEPNVYNYTPS